MSIDRRELMTTTAVYLLLSAVPARARIIAGGLPWQPEAGAPPKPVRPGPWVYFTPEEGIAIEAIADRLVPPDPETPGGKDAGCAVFIDRQLAGPYGSSEGLGGKHRYPAMPYPYYAKMTREDALAIRAYLETLEPVHNEVVSNQLPFPYSIRANMTVWNALFFTSGPFKPVAGKADEWNRGAYLVDGLAHCGACHTAKNILGGDKTNHALQGGELQGW
jgi:Gluconate 2-dehydrogenase subunit 3